MEVHTAAYLLPGTLHDLLELGDFHGLLVLEEDHEALLVLATPPCTSRHLCVFVGSQESEASGSVVVFLERGEDHRLRGHVQAHGKGLGCKEDLDESLSKEDLNDLLEHGEQTGMMKGDSLLKQGLDLVELREGLQE